MKSPRAFLALFLCVDLIRTLRRGLAERKIGYFNSDLLGSLLMDWSKLSIDRDAASVRYWITIGVRILALAGCLFVAIFGWVPAGS